MRNWLSLTIVVVASALAMSAPDALASSATWRLEPALAPPPPPGVQPAPYPIPVGHVAAISFWAPNRGLLITASGLYAYNGEHWHELATVCGGEEGRIAWAGPDDFWTISDQRPGQPLPPKESVSLQSISLCHFLNGQVVGSYAMPLGQTDSYLPMDAAACYGPSDCWFGGAVGRSPSFGAFHLHWNGSTVSAVYGPEDHSVTGMVNFAGQLFESVQISSGDVFLPAGSSSAAAHPPVIHTIAPGEGTPEFDDEVIEGHMTSEEGDSPLPDEKPLPEYGGKSVPPWSLEGFMLTSDGSPLGSEAGQLWAIANPLDESGWSSESPVVLHGVARRPERPSELSWSQLSSTVAGRIVAAAAEPDSEGVWLSMAGDEGDTASVTRLEASGAVKRETLPSAHEPVGFRGAAGAIACPAANDCWMATEGVGLSGLGSLPGWLFHLTDGVQYPLDTDPSFAGVITYRPPDASVPVIYPDLPPEDDSLVNQITITPPSDAQPVDATSRLKVHKGKQLVTHVKSKFLHGRVLVISFTLTGRAHVQLIGRRGHRVVASTRDESLRPGRHQLSLDLNLAQWPTKLQFKASPVTVEAPSTESSSSSSSSDTVTTG